MKRPTAAALAFACLLAALAATSAPRDVGDAAEYVRMADRIASLHLPGVGESRHFVFYSALAAPFRAALQALRLDPAWAFTLLNGLLLAMAFRVTVSRLHWSWSAVVFAGPILWWIDKPHTEPFTFALVAAAFALSGSAPWWSFAAAGAAATQNPGHAALLLPLAASAAASRPAVLKDRRFVAGLAAGLALAALHPLYYLVRAGTVSRLATTSDVRALTRSEYVAALADPNLGLLPNAPIFAAVLAGAVIALLARAPRRVLAPPVVAAAVSAAWLAFVAGTATNVNHGGTPGLSRYATWFVPLAIPVFLEADRRFPRVRRWMAVPALAAAICSIWTFHPARAEAPGRPTRLAAFLWTHHPSWDDPLPEVFDERLRGLDENWLPAATAGCEKVLLPGRGGRDSVWPVPCAPMTVPARCRDAGALCYANRTGPGYAFVEARVSAPQAFRLDRAATWPRTAEGAAARALTALSWWTMRVSPPGSPGAVVRSVRRVGRVSAWQAEDRLFVFAEGVEPGAELIAEPPRSLRGTMTTERGTGAGMAVSIAGGQGPQAIPLPAPEAWVILELRAR